MASTTAINYTANSGKALFNGSPEAVHQFIVRVQPPHREDLQLSYAKVLKPDQEDTNSHGWYAAMIDSLGIIIGTCGAVPCCVVCPNPYHSVQQGTVSLVTKFSCFARAVDPGLIRVDPLLEKLISIDVKMQIVGMYISNLLLSHDFDSYDI
jgi:erythrocyte band 7 integral membrane protein